MPARRMAYAPPRSIRSRETSSKHATSAGVPRFPVNAMSFEHIHHGAERHPRDLPDRRMRRDRGRCRHIRADVGQLVGDCPQVSPQSCLVAAGRADQEGVHVGVAQD